MTQKLFRAETVSEIRDKLEEQGLDSLSINELLVHTAAFFNDEVTTFNEEFKEFVEDFKQVRKGISQVVRVAKWVISSLITLSICVVGSVIAYFILR